MGSVTQSAAIQLGKVRTAVTRYVGTVVFGRLYVWLAGAILAATTAYWAVLGAKVQQSNADQLVDSYLFENLHTFHGASFPGAHTFLLKWPVFLTMKWLHFSPGAFMGATVALALVTVVLFAYILYRIERRPLIIGTILLALASVLLLVPAQPYPGGLLPVNMAMIATRNIEYVWYMAALILLLRAQRSKSWWFAGALVLLGILIASDKLFFDMSLGGALLMLIAYSARRRLAFVGIALRWLACSVLAYLLAWVMLSLLQATMITHIVSQSTIGPYATVHEAKTLFLGSIYAGFGLLANFGANPALYVSLLREVPWQLLHGLASIGAIGYIANFALFMAGLYTSLRVALAGLVHGQNAPQEKELPDTPIYFSVMLIWTTVAAIAIFVGSNHYYPVDARYVAIALFAVFSAAATYLRKTSWRPMYVAAAGAVLLVAIGAGTFPLWHTYKAELAAMQVTNKRNTTAAQILKQHSASVLVGDYWRVLPIRLDSGNSQRVMPMDGCVQPREALSSTAWQPDLHNLSFAYLLSADTSLTGYPPCTLKEVVDVYGRPNASVPIAGTLTHPQELLLFYDRGTHHSAPTTPPTPGGPATVVPITPEELPYTSCPVPTTMNVVAHQDDDLLFMNPDLIHDLKAGHCVRTVYITAGDAGSNQYFWLSREKGSEAAYSTTLGSNAVWVHRIVKLSDHQFVTVANPRGNAKISLIFMHLPDGDLYGTGFPASHHESLARLEDGSINTIHSVDGQSNYTSPELTNALTRLMHLYEPAEIRTQSNMTNPKALEHSDHRAVGRYTTQAYHSYETQQFEQRVVIPLKYYIGYPGRTMPENVLGADLIEKKRMFFAYGLFDKGVCQRANNECDAKTNNYSAYLRRQYQSTY